MWKNHDAAHAHRGRPLWRRVMLAAAMLNAALLLAAVKVAGSVSIADEKTAGLPDGWKRRITIPAVKPKQVVWSRESRVMLWVEKGWLLARRTTVENDFEWQIVLARASDAEKPQVKVNEAAGGCEVRYRGYFVREIGGKLRVYRERKTDQSPDWPEPDLAGERRSLGGGGADTAYIDSFALNQWCWVRCGSSSERPDLWVRLQPTTVRKGDASRGNAINGVCTMRGGPVEMFYGDSQIQDEGDLLFATRVTTLDAERGLEDFKLRAALQTRPAPALAGDEWFNAREPLSLETLKGNVVLLHFWGQWCDPAVTTLPQIEELHKKFRERGLIVIGVHSAERSDGTDRFLRDNKVSFPVMIDNGETLKRYQIGALPNFFLVDKAGDVAWGFGTAPPDDVRIQELLK